ncbi:MAG: glycosyltransferase [Gemmatimonadota bacterium]
MMHSGHKGTVVIVAYYYPPLVGIASERAAALARHLPLLGWRVVVVTPAKGFYHGKAIEEASHSGGPPSLPPHGVQVVRTRSPELSRGLRRIWETATRPSHPVEREASGVVRPVATGALGGILRRKVREWLYLPDAQRAWVAPAARAAGLALRGVEGPRVILSSSVPYSAHLAARRLSTRTGVPWVAEFRDPWTTAHESLRPRSRLRRKLDERWEAAILRDAHAVVHTSRTTQEAVLQRFPPADPAGFSVIMNGFEPLPPGSPPSPDAPFLLLHAGTLAPGVDPSTTLEAVQRLHARHPGGVRFVHLGDPVPWREASEGRWRAAPWLETPGVVTPAEAREAMVDASANLVHVPGETYRAIIPGKLLEYLGARRPVLAIVPEGSEMEALGQRYGEVHLAPTGTAEEVHARLEVLWEAHRAGSLQTPRVESAVVEPLTRGAQARKWSQLLEEVVR